MKAGDVKEGDVLIPNMRMMPRVKGVMSEGETTLIFWGDGRALDAVCSEQHVSVVPQQCPRCGLNILEEDNE